MTRRCMEFQIFVFSISIFQAQYRLQKVQDPFFPLIWRYRGSFVAEGLCKEYISTVYYSGFMIPFSGTKNSRNFVSIFDILNVKCGCKATT